MKQQISTHIPPAAVSDIELVANDGFACGNELVITVLGLVCSDFKVANPYGTEVGNLEICR